MLADTIREHYENNQPLDEILHEEAMQEFYHYCIVGGMPAAVKADLAKDSHVIPVECKVGNHVKAKSMMVYMEKYDPVYAIRISTRNFGMVKGIKSVPLYSVFCI